VLLCVVYCLLSGHSKCKKRNLEVNDTQLCLVKPKKADVLDFLFACILLNVHFNWKVFQVQGMYLN